MSMTVIQPILGDLYLRAITKNLYGVITFVWY